MKRTLACALGASLAFIACNKSAETEAVSLTASATQTTIGEPVTVTLTSSANAASWSVSPAATATKAYGITTSRTNQFTFSQAGTYTVGVRVRNVASLSATQSLDSAWKRSGADKGGCTHGQDSASVQIVVTK